MSFFIEKEVECNFNFDYEKVAEAVVSASLEQESFHANKSINLECFIFMIFPLFMRIL